MTPCGLQEAIPLLLPEQPVSVSVVSGPVVTEIRQTWASWASLVTRLYAGADTLEQVNRRGGRQGCLQEL